jgi:hypothetical protein
MDEGRDPAAERGSRPAAAAGVRLSPAQEAYGQYARHFNGCWACRDIDQCCSIGQQLHRDWREQIEEAAQQIGEILPRS